MSGNTQVPNYDLEDQLVVSEPAQLRALSNPLRITLLDLVLERAGTVTELAVAVDRPKSTIAHHVGVLVAAGLLRIVRTHRVRAIDERYYGRTARSFHIGVVNQPGDPATPVCINRLSMAAAESVPAHQEDRLFSTLFHARIPREHAAEFWQRVEAVAQEFAQLPRSGSTVYGFAAGLYPTEHPTLPEVDGPGSAGTADGPGPAGSPD